MSLSELLTAKNHIEASRYIEQCCHEERCIDEGVVLHLHGLLLKDIHNEAGEFRDDVVSVGGAFFMPSPPHEIRDRLEKLCREVNASAGKGDPIEIAAIFHHRLVQIHPFKDGNGRTARLLMNKILMDSGFPFITEIRENEKEKYLDCLKLADIGDDSVFVNFIARKVEATLTQYLLKLEHSEVISLSEASEQGPYSQEYLSLLARKGTIGAFKKYNEAKAEKDRINVNGIPDAFVVAFHGNKRISNSEASRILRGE